MIALYARLGAYARQNIAFLPSILIPGEDHVVAFSGGTKMKRQPLPFSVNRNDARSLVDQVADGLRQAIVSGHWRVGDELPSTRELVPLLGVWHLNQAAAPLAESSGKSTPFEVPQNYADRKV